MSVPVHWNNSNLYVYAKNTPNKILAQGGMGEVYRTDHGAVELFSNMDQTT